MNGKQAESLLSGLFINRKSFKRKAHSSSGFCSFVWNFKFVAQNEPQNNFYQRHVLSKIELLSQLLEKHVRKLTTLYWKRLHRNVSIWCHQNPFDHSYATNVTALKYRLNFLSCLLIFSLSKTNIALPKYTSP